jgi:hypothetical protein
MPMSGCWWRLPGGDPSARPKGTRRVARERDPTVVVDVVQGQRGDHMVERGVLGGDPVDRYRITPQRWRRTERAWP